MTEFQTLEAHSLALNLVRPCPPLRRQPSSVRTLSRRSLPRHISSIKKTHCLSSKFPMSPLVHFFSKVPSPLALFRPSPPPPPPPTFPTGAPSPASSVTRPGKDTAGSPFSYNLRHCHNFCCGGPISNPRPVLDSSVQTTRGMILDFCCKTSKHARLTSHWVLGTKLAL